MTSSGCPVAISQQIRNHYPLHVSCILPCLHPLTPMLSGQGLAGLVVSVSAMLTQLAASPIDTCSDDGDDGDCVNTLNYSALAYFLIATFVLVFCIFAFMTLKRLAFTRYCPLPCACCVLCAPHGTAVLVICLPPLLLSEPLDIKGNEACAC